MVHWLVEVQEGRKMRICRTLGMIAAVIGENEGGLFACAVICLATGGIWWGGVFFLTDNFGACVRSIDIFGSDRIV